MFQVHYCSSSFNESDIESDEDCNVSEFQKDEDVLLASCEVITKYVQYGYIGCSNTDANYDGSFEQPGAQQRIEGLTYFQELLSLTSFSSMYLDCIACYGKL